MDEQPKPSDDEIFTQLVAPLELDKAEKAFARLLESYVAKMEELKHSAPWHAVVPVMSTGRWMLHQLAMDIFGLTEIEAAQTVEDGVLVARHNLTQ